MLRRAWRRLAATWRTPAPDYANSVADIAPETARLFERVQRHTMTSLPRIHALVEAVDYLVQRRIEGAIVECGVWHGGSVMAMMERLRQLDAARYEFYLYDTFEGMTRPGEQDTSKFEPPALATWRAAEAAGKKAWDYLFPPTEFTLDKVRERVLATGYPSSLVHFVKGPVEQTLPARAPPAIALLRLDTDWYESTWHELVHLYPRLSPGGVLVIDDYGHWEGCRRAVDRYFGEGHAPRILLDRIDYTARIGIKW